MARVPKHIAYLDVIKTISIELEKYDIRSCDMQGS